jgi:hypothetical protein
MPEEKQNASPKYRNGNWISLSRAAYRLAIPELDLLTTPLNPESSYDPEKTLRKITSPSALCQGIVVQTLCKTLNGNDLFPNAFHFGYTLLGHFPAQGS